MQKLATALGVALVLIAAIVFVGRTGEQRKQDGTDSPRSRNGHAAANEALNGGPGSKSSRTERKREHRTAIYSGPDGPTGWIQSSTPKETGESELSWDFVEGKLVSHSAGAIAREIVTPSRTKISFQLAWEEILRFRLLWGADTGESTQPDNTFDLVIQKRFVYLRKRWLQRDSGGSRIIGQAAVAALDKATDAFFELYLDREAGLVSLYVNGQSAFELYDKDPGMGTFGDWLQFVAEELYPLEVSDLLVQSWSGTFPDGRTVETLEEVQAREQWIASLNPAKTWPPEVEYQRVARQAALAGRAAGRGANPTEVEAAEKALRAEVDARIRLDRATSELPLAEPDPQQPGHVINPFTKLPLDVRGVKSGTRVRDPSDPDPTHVFRVP